MDKRPLVSIIIPLYNGSNYIEEALQSALSQTYTPIEILVVNDGSTDGGAGKAICARYADRIHYYEKENGGCASALNFGIRQARGAFISWLSHDDLYTPQKVEKQVAMYETYNLDMTNTLISSCGVLIDGEGKRIPHPGRRETGLYSSLRAFTYILFKRCPNGCALLIPKDCFEKYGYFEEGLRYILDWDLWLKFALLGADFYFDREKLVCHRLHGMQVSVQQKERYGMETEYVMRRLFALASEHKADAEWLQKMYAYAFACKSGAAEAMGTYLRKEKIRINGLHCIVLRRKRFFRQLAKELYHKVR